MDSSDPSFSPIGPVHQHIERYENDDDDENEIVNVPKFSPNPSKPKKITQPSTKQRTGVVQQENSKPPMSSVAQKESQRNALLRASLADLTSACQRLGRSKLINKKSVYEKSLECEGQLEDIMRYLLQEDYDFPEDRKYSDTMGTTGVIVRDVIPLLITYPDNINLSMMLLKVLYMVTRQPLKNWVSYNKLIDHQRKIKEGFIKLEVLPIFSHKVAEVLTHEGSLRSKDDNEYIELLLGIIANLLLVPNKTDTELSSNPLLTHLQEDFIVQCHKDMIFDVVMIIGQRIEEPENTEFAGKILEILSHLLFISPEEIASFEPARSQSQKPSAVPQPIKSSGIARALEEEQLKLKMATSQLPTRHSRFGGTFVTNTTIGQNVIRNSQITQIKEKPLTVANQRRQKTAQPTQEIKQLECKENWNASHGTKISIQSIMKQFVADGIFGALVRIVRSNVELSGNVDVKSIRQLCALITWCLAFQRHAHASKNAADLSENKDFDLAHVTEAISPEFLQFIMRGVSESSLEKRWDDLVHYCYCLKEQLNMLRFLEKIKSPVAQKLLIACMRSFFYDIESVELIPDLMKKYSLQNQPKRLMEVLIEISYNVVQLMESYEKSQRIVVCKKTRRTVSFHENKKSAESTKPTTSDTLPTENEDKNPSDTNAFGGNTNLEHEPTHQDLEKGEFVAEKGADISAHEGEEIAKGSDDDESSQKETFIDSADAFYNVKYFIARFSHPFVIENMLLVLYDYGTLSRRTVHASMKIFHHIAVGLGFFKMFFLISHFRLFDKLLSDPLSKKNEELLNFRDFAKFIINKFVEHAKENPGEFIEVLFYRSARSCIEEVVSEHEEEPKEKGRKGTWTKEDEDYLHDLHDEYRDDPNGLQIVCDKMPHKTEKQIKARVRKLGLIRLRKPRSATINRGKGDGKVTSENDNRTSESESESEEMSDNESEASRSGDSKEENGLNPESFEQPKERRRIEDNHEKAHQSTKKMSGLRRLVKRPKSDIVHEELNDSDSQSSGNESIDSEHEKMMEEARLCCVSVAKMSQGLEFLGFVERQISKAIQMREQFVRRDLDEIDDIVLCPESIAQLDACMSHESNRLLGNVMNYEIPKDGVSSFYVISKNKPIAQLQKDRRLIAECLKQAILTAENPVLLVDEESQDANLQTNPTSGYETTASSKKRKLIRAEEDEELIEI